MGKWIKENWFKVGVLATFFVAGVSIAYYYVLFLPKTHLDTTMAKESIEPRKKDLELQAMCAKKAEEAFKENYPKTQGELFSYTCHYNRKLNKCFVLINGALVDIPGQASNVSSLYDAYEYKMYADYHQVVKEGQHYYDTPPFICTTLDKTCDSRQEYDNFVKPYMEE